MSKISRDVKKYVIPYQAKNGERFKVVIPDGRGLQIREQGFLSYADALAFAVKQYTKVLTSKSKYVNAVTSNITFEQYAAIFLTAKKRNQVADVTLVRYGDQIKNFLNPFFGSMKLNRIEKLHLKNYIRESYENGISSYNANSTVNLFKMIIRHALDDDYEIDERILLVKNPKHTARDPVFWTVEQMKYFLNAASSHKSFMLWKFALYTGMRACEVTALKWDCVFLNLHSGGHTGFVLVKRSRAQKATVVSEKTKNGEKRMIPLSPEVKEIISSLEKNKSSGDFVFGGEHSIDTSHWSRDLKKEIKKYPTLPMVTYHELRHSFCSYLDATGMPRRIVAAIMGHKDLNTTNRYSHVNDQMIGSEYGRWLEQQVQKNQQNSNKVGVV